MVLWDVGDPNRRRSGCLDEVEAWFAIEGVAVEL